MTDQTTISWLLLAAMYAALIIHLWVRDGRQAEAVERDAGLGERR